MNRSAIAADSASAPGAQQPNATSGALHGPWLLVARGGWVALTLLILALNAIAIPTAIETLRSGCQSGAQCLGVQLSPAILLQFQQMGISPDFLAAYQVAGAVAATVIHCALAALIVWRRSTDPMALFCASMLALVGGATYTGLLDAGLRPLSPSWYWPVGIIEFLGLASLLTFFLLFPRGRFAPRWTLWLVPVILLSEAHYVFFMNASQVEGASDAFPIDFLLFALLVLCLSALQVYRYRRISTYRERQQTKWVVFGFSLAMVGYLVSFTLEHLSLPQQPAQASAILTLVAGTLSIAFLLLIPVSIAVAILRSRLYDIDLLINRTLVYGSLTAILALVYIAGVVGVQALVNTVARQESADPAPLLIVITTLAVAALFQPLRRSLQRAIDRRFYRRKYNVEQTLAAFGATLRQEVDLRALNDHLLRVVQQTMEPASLSLWLRAPDDHA